MTRRRARPPLVLFALAVPAALAGCRAGPDGAGAPGGPRWTAPWWPAAPAAAPSPLLDAVGLAPPPLTGPLCSAEGGPRLRPRDWPRWGAWRAAADWLVHGPGATCLLPGPAPAGTPGFSVEDRGPPALSLVRTAPGGRVEYASHNSAGLSAAEGQAAADSVLRRGLGLPGARPLACGTLDPVHGGAPVRGWATPDYQAIVLVQPGWLRSARGHVVSIQVTSTRFPACDPHRRGPGGAAAGRGAPAA